MLYGMGLIVAASLIGGTVLLAIFINLVREWFEAQKTLKRR